VLASAIAARPPPRRDVSWRSTTAARGLSDHDRNPKNYAILVELADVIARARGPQRRARPSSWARRAAASLPWRWRRNARGAVAGAVLNDIGPVIAVAGADAYQRLCGQAAGAAHVRRRR